MPPNKFHSYNPLYDVGGWTVAGRAKTASKSHQIAKSAQSATSKMEKGHLQRSLHQVQCLLLQAGNPMQKGACDAVKLIGQSSCQASFAVQLQVHLFLEGIASCICCRC